jgi:tRNA(His) guanylyltransferase
MFIWKEIAMIDDLGDRMKEYENVTRNCLTRRTPVIIRIDGKAFHTFTAGCNKPFDALISSAMNAVCRELFNHAQNCKLIYTQSDEISLLLVDYGKLEVEPWFGNNIQKIVSVLASVATATFNANYKHPNGKFALFDARAFNIPADDVCNYFLWRQQDCMRNSISVTARSHFSQKQLSGKSGPQMIQMMADKGFNYSDIELGYRQGFIHTIKDFKPCPSIKLDRKLITQHSHPSDEVVNPGSNVIVSAIIKMRVDNKVPQLTTLRNRISKRIITVDLKLSDVESVRKDKRVECIQISSDLPLIKPVKE